MRKDSPLLAYYYKKLPKYQIKGTVTTDDVWNKIKAAQNANLPVRTGTNNAGQNNKNIAASINNTFNTGNISQATNVRTDEKVKGNIRNLNQQANQQAIEDKKQQDIRIKERLAAKDFNEGKSKTFTLPNDETKTLDQMNWRERQYVAGKSLEGKGRFFENEESLIDDINPLNWITGMAGALGEAPYQAKQSGSNMPYVSAILNPLLMGRMMGSGSINPLGKKLWTNEVSNPEFLNAVTMGIPGMVKGAANKVGQSMESGILSNASKINPFAGTFAGESKLPNFLQLNKLDDANAFYRLTKDPKNLGLGKGAYFNKGVPLTTDLAETFPKGSRAWGHRYSGPKWNPKTGKIDLYDGPDYLFKVTDASKMQPHLNFPEPHLDFYAQSGEIPAGSPSVQQFKKDWWKGWTKQTPNKPISSTVGSIESSGNIGNDLESILSKQLNQEVTIENNPQYKNQIKYFIKNKDGENIATFYGENRGNDIHVTGIEVQENMRRQGVGSSVYKSLQKYLDNTTEGQVISHGPHSFTLRDPEGRSIAPANLMWENLVKLGVAEKVKGPFTYIYKMKPSAALQQKKQGGVLPKAKVGMQKGPCGPGEIFLEGTGCISINSKMYMDLYNSGKIAQQNPDGSITGPTMKEFVVNSKARPTTFTLPSYPMPINRTDVIGRTPIEEIKYNQQGEQINAQNVAESKKQFISQGHASTPDEIAWNKLLTKKAISGLPNVTYNEETGTTSAVNPNMTAEGQPANFMGERQQKNYEHVMGALEAAGYLTGAGELAGAGYNALKPMIAESMESGLLSNAYKLNPWRFKPNPEAYYRGIGRTGLDDAIESGVLRSNRKESFGDDLYLSSSFNEADYYANNKLPWTITDDGTIVSDLVKGKGIDTKKYFAEIPKQNANVTPHYINNTQFISKDVIPLDNIKLLKQDWLRGYKQVPKEKNGGDISIPQLSTQVPSWAGKYADGGLTKYQVAGTVCPTGFFKNAFGHCINAAGQTPEQAKAGSSGLNLSGTTSTAFDGSKYSGNSGNTGVYRMNVEDTPAGKEYNARLAYMKQWGVDSNTAANAINMGLSTQVDKQNAQFKKDKGYTTKADIEKRKSYSQPYVATNQNATTDDKGNIIPKHADTDLQGNVIDAQANRQRRMSGVAAGLTAPLIGAAAVMGAGEVLPALDAAGTAVYNWGAANPALQIFNAGMKTAPSWAPGLTGYSALGLGFGMQSANQFADPNSETRTSYTQAYNNPTLGNIGTATGHTLVNTLGILGSPGVAQGLGLGAKAISKGVGLGSDILNSAYKLNPNAGKIPFVEGKPNWLTGWSKDYSDPTKIDFSGFSKFTGSIKGTKEVKEFEKLNKWWSSLPIEKRLDKTIGKYYMDESKRLINQAQLKKTGLADLFDVSTAFKPGVYADFVAPFKNTPNIVFKYGKEPFIGQTEEMVLNNNAFNLGDETIGLPFHSQNVNNRVASLMPKVTGQGSSFGITNKPDFEISRKAAAEMALKLRRLQKLGIHADWKGDNFMFNPETNKLSVFDLNMAPVENSGFAKRFASGTNKIGENAATIMKQNWNLSAKPPRKLNVSDFTDRNNRVKEAWEAAKNQQSGTTPPPITAEQYRAFLKQQKLQQQAGDFLRTQGQPDPSIGGWSPINNPETNRMVGLAQYGKPQKLTNLDFVTSEQLMNDNLFQKEFLKQTKLLDGFGLDTRKKIEIAVNKTLDALKNNSDYNMDLGLERSLQRIMRGPSTYNQFSKDFRPEFLWSQKPLGSQAKGVMRANPSGGMDRNFSINDPNIKVLGDEAIIGKESVLSPEQISMRKNAAGDFVPSKILSIYQKQLSSALEKLNLQPFTGTNAFNMLTPNKEGGLTKFTNGGNVNIGQEMTVSTQQLEELRRQGYKIQML